MKEQNIIQQKSFNFPLKIIKLFQSLKNEKEYVLSKQLLRCGTSIGANIEEAIGGQSRKDFFMKINIAYKEARETNYWLKLLKDSNLIEIKTAELLINECEEILKILGTIIKTMKNSSNEF